MDISAIIVIVVLLALSLGAIVWMEIHSRKAGSREPRLNRSDVGLNEE